MREDRKNRVYSVLSCLPDDGEKCLCFGYETYCCKEDMEDERQWHEVIFRFTFSSYKLKKELPEDIEESVLEYYKVMEIWALGEKFCDGHVIGVTKWKHLPEKE